MAAWLKWAAGPVHGLEAEEWLRGDPAADQIKAALAGVLMKLWLDAWKAGAKGAGETAGDFVKIPDQIVADRISRMAARWLQEVTDTVLGRLAAILAKGGSAAGLEAAVKALLADEAHARLIVVTETTRAMAMAAMEVYRAARVEKVRWITRSANPCPVCLVNEAAGPVYVGEPFPSGSTAPPEHPNCECALIPAED